MIKKREEVLFFKYVNKTISKNEEIELLGYLRDVSKKEYLQRMIGNDFAVDIILKEFDSQKTIKNVHFLIKNERRNKKRNHILGLVAMFLLFIGIATIYIIRNDHSTIIEMPQLVVVEEQVIMESTNGNRTAIYGEQSEVVYNEAGRKIGEVQEGAMVLDSEVKEIEYKTLRVPYGKSFSVVLADGSKATLNAGSKIKFPTSFVGLIERVVEVEGEVYFNVARNKNQPFIVKSAFTNVQVLGTSFLVSAYDNDINTSVILEEGEVKFYNRLNDEQAVYLNPNQRAIFDKERENISVEQVDTRQYLSWMKGDLVFRNKTFKEISKRLERHYNIIIVSNSKTLDETVFNASFNKKSIEEVLVYFNEVLAIQYKIEDNKIFITD